MIPRPLALKLGTAQCRSHVPSHLESYVPSQDPRVPGPLRYEPLQAPGKRFLERLAIEGLLFRGMQRHHPARVVDGPGARAAAVRDLAMEGSLRGAVVESRSDAGPGTALRRRNVQAAGRIAGDGRTCELARSDWPGRAGYGHYPQRAGRDRPRGYLTERGWMLAWVHLRRREPWARWSPWWRKERMANPTLP